MPNHKKLDVYRISLLFVAWAYRHVRKVRGIDRSTKDQLVRASQSVTLNIAEGNGKRSDADRKRYFDIARASALESGAVLDILVACGIYSEREVAEGEQLVDRIVAMLTRMLEAESSPVRQPIADRGS